MIVWCPRPSCTNASTHVITWKLLTKWDCPFGFDGGRFRLVLRSETVNCPPRSQAAQQKRNGRSEENHRCSQKVLGCGQRLCQGRNDQVNRPAHNPGRGYQQPNPEQTPTPIQGSRVS